MKEIYIEVENTKLAELGVDQEYKWKPLRFRENALLGYWISDESIIVYIGAQTFLCKISTKNIELLDSILDL